MRQNLLHPKTWRLIKVALEIIAVSGSWILFFLSRKLTIDKLPYDEALSLFHDVNLYFGLTANVILWIAISLVIGRYSKVFVESRLAKQANLFSAVFFSSLVLYFALFIDDRVSSPHEYYKILLIYAGLQSLFVTLSSLLYQLLLKIQYRQGKIHTLVMDFGSDDTPLGSHKGIAYQKCTLDLLDKPNFTSVLEDNPVHVWRVFEPFDLNALTAEHFNALVSSAVEVRLYHTSGNQYPFKQFMDYSIGSYYCAPITPVMSSRQKAVKRTMDIGLSLVGLVLSIPICLVCAIGIKCTSKGPIFYAQERIGLHRQPFQIYKFRSMIIDAEKDGPQLSNERDPRITSWGQTLRKWRLDEIPQLWNVLRGDMSLVGPRPEREFYIKQIQKTEALHARLYTTKPGLTSLGMVKFGYARNLEEIIERMRYDMVYLDNQSIFFDMQILLFTVRTVILGKGI